MPIEALALTSTIPMLMVISKSALPDKARLFHLVPHGMGHRQAESSLQFSINTPNSSPEPGERVPLTHAGFQNMGGFHQQVIPAVWPQVSFTNLNWSISRKRSQWVEPAAFAWSKI